MEAQVAAAHAEREAANARYEAPWRRCAGRPSPSRSRRARRRPEPPRRRPAPAPSPSSRGQPEEGHLRRHLYDDRHQDADAMWIGNARAAKSRGLAEARIRPSTSAPRVKTPSSPGLEAPPQDDRRRRRPRPRPRRPTADGLAAPGGLLAANPPPSRPSPRRRPRRSEDPEAPTPPRLPPPRRRLHVARVRGRLRAGVSSAVAEADARAASQAKVESPVAEQAGALRRARGAPASRRARGPGRASLGTWRWALPLWVWWSWELGEWASWWWSTAIGGGSCASRTWFGRWGRTRGP